MKLWLVECLVMGGKAGRPALGWTGAFWALTPERAIELGKARHPDIEKQVINGREVWTAVESPPVEGFIMRTFRH